MRFQAFVKELHEAGWRAPLDAQHIQIKKLWTRMFPTVAELESELEDAEHEAENQRKRDECIGRHGAYHIVNPQ
jgi:hypothetical protein